MLTPPLVSRRKSPPNSSTTVPPQLISVASLNYWRVRILKLGGLAPPINYAGNGCYLLTLSIVSSWWYSCHLVWFWHYFSCYSLHTTHKVHPMWKKQRGKSFNSLPLPLKLIIHYSDVIMSAMASQITSITIVYSIVYTGADQRKHQSSAWGEFTGHRKIPHTKGQWRGKCFHLMTSSWENETPIGSGNGLVLSVNKSLPEPMLI